MHAHHWGCATTMRGVGSCWLKCDWRRRQNASRNGQVEGQLSASRQFSPPHPPVKTVQPSPPALQILRLAARDPAGILQLGGGSLFQQQQGGGKPDLAMATAVLTIKAPRSPQLTRAWIRRKL